MFASCLARRHRERVLAARAWNSWRALVEGSWRERVEKACQTKAREVCMQLSDDYEKKMASVRKSLINQEVKIILSLCAPPSFSLGLFFLTLPLAVFVPIP